MNPNATIHNVKLDKYFSVTSNDLPEDPKLSWEAKGLLWYLISRPSDWKVYVRQLSGVYQGNKKGGGRDAIHSFLKELKDQGYLIHTKKHNKKGFWEHSYHVYPMKYQNFVNMFPQAPESLRADNPDVVSHADNPDVVVSRADYPDLDQPDLVEPDIYQIRKETRNDLTKKSVIQGGTPPGSGACAPEKVACAPSFSEEEKDHSMQQVSCESVTNANLKVSNDYHSELENIEESVDDFIPYKIIVNTPKGQEEIYQSDLFCYLSNSKEKLCHIYEAWKKLAKYQSVVHDWRRFIIGTIENIKKKELSETIKNNTKHKKENVCSNTKKTLESTIKESLKPKGSFLEKDMWEQPFLRSCARNTPLSTKIS